VTYAIPAAIPRLDEGCSLTPSPGMIHDTEGKVPLAAAA
jgi:hypothetical protein